MHLPWMGALLAALADAAPIVPIAPDGAEAPAWGDCAPPSSTSAVEADRLARHFAALRAADPAVFGPSPLPEAPVTWPGEFTTRQALALTWPADPDLDPVALAIVKAALPATRVVVVVDPSDASALRRAMARSGVAIGEAPGAVGMVEAPNRSVWLRDAGPVPVFMGDSLVAIDPQFFTDCIDDDALPTRTHLALGADAAMRSPVWMMGGSLLTDGAGTCFTTPALAEANDVTGWQAGGPLEAWFGCRQVVTLPELLGAVIDHIDMMLAVAGPTTLLLGEVDRTEDPVNHARLEEAAARLEAARTLDGLAYRVIRVPMVPRESRPIGPDEPPLRSWLNLVPLNDRVLVPVYSDTDPVVQAAAIARIATAFPDRELVAIQADAAGARYGALRCLTVTMPAHP
jgi:agmatine/peptidylarginine deiminase